MLLISIKIWLFEMGFEHILLKELLYLSSFGLVSYLSISTKPIIDNININELKNVNIIEIAIGKNHYKSQLIVRNGNSGTGTLEKTIQEQIVNEKNYKVVEINVDSIDNLINNNNILNKPDFVKIDVEGLDLEVLEGMEKTIQKYYPDLFIEIHGGSMNLKKLNIANIFSFLDSYNYKVCHIESGKNILKNNILGVTQLDLKK
jgi:FkbM family methyltransferase